LCYIFRVRERNGDNIMALRVQFLWWEGCPSHPEARQRLQQALAELGIQAHIEDTRLLTDEEAERLHFPGSPTIQVEGQDIDPKGAEQPSRLACRLYFLEDGKPSPVPSVAMIKRALAKAQAHLDAP
jgi:hypothetical protein